MYKERINKIPGSLEEKSKERSNKNNNSGVIIECNLLDNNSCNLEIK